MRIERVETFPLLYPLSEPYGDANGYKKYRSCFLLRIITDSGVDGWGECIDWLPTLVKGFTERIIPYLIGKKATDRLHIVSTIEKWHRRAASGVGMALTEIVAKAAGVHVCEWWGGRLRQSVPVYASFQSYTPREAWIEESVRQVERAVSEGFLRVKVKVGGRTLPEDEKHILSLQSVLEGTAELAIDANQSYDLSTARRWERILSRYANIMWFEEPMPMDHVWEYKALRQSLSIPLAGGENLQGVKQFLPLLLQGGIDIVQPDVMHVLGPDEHRDALQLARSFGLRASPHAFDGALSRLYAIFAQACLPAWSKMKGEEIEPVEWDLMENPFTALFPLQPQNGSVSVPTGPGIGVEPDREMIETYRWDGFSYA
ncbi:mandelate racemase/muconate lactonizing enzyme family protein [Bacillaceae bacterium]